MNVSNNENEILRRFENEILQWFRNNRVNVSNNENEISQWFRNLSHPHRIWWMQTFQDMINNEGNGEEHIISPDNPYIQTSPTAIRELFEVPVCNYNTNNTDNTDNYNYYKN